MSIYERQRNNDKSSTTAETHTHIYITPADYNQNHMQLNFHQVHSNTTETGYGLYPTQYLEKQTILSVEDFYE